MEPQGHDRQQPAKRKADGGSEKHEERHEADAREKAEQAARSVMHPEGYDREWRFYHGAWGG